MSATDLARVDAKRRHLYALIGSLNEPQVDRLLERAGEMFRERLEDEMRVRNVVTAGLAELRDATPIVAPRFLPAACADPPAVLPRTPRTPPTPFHDWPGICELGGEGGVE